MCLYYGYVSHNFPPGPSLLKELLVHCAPTSLHISEQSKPLYGDLYIRYGAHAIVALAIEIRRKAESTSDISLLVTIAILLLFSKLLCSLVNSL